MFFDISNNSSVGFGVQAPLAKRMIGLHHLSRYQLINDDGHFSVNMDFHPFRHRPADLGTAGHDQWNMFDLVFFPELGRGSLQPLEIVAEEVDVRGDFLGISVFLNNSVDLFDQTGQTVVECPSVDDDDKAVVVSVIPGPRANWVAVFRTATLDTADVE